ncbi:MAG: hypothetical protein H0X37_01015 [Herpetosiphonaceae bacterium]|nr:hypothetical protein [Herpetosiphonaceae bacterium]
MYKIAVGYGGVGSLAWLVIAVTRLLDWRRHEVAAETAVGQFREDVLRFGGHLLIDGIFALAVAVIIAFVLYKLLQATWNSWDWATATVGGAAVLSLVLLCAQQRVIALVPFTLFPLWWLLYRPAVKQVCGVGSEEDTLPEEENDLLTGTTEG